YMYSEGTKFKMGNALNLEIAVPISYNLNEHFSIQTKPFYSYWKFQHSDWVNGAMEPDSQTNSLGLQLGISYKF
ncbi:MAG: hypothetical protein ACP5PO_08980, partial [Desulfurella sp.]|uniref:hypothetical protein n=1 Tax=Desulfurella sp. TaxID=1962857 RepID=UPI003D0CC48E